MSRREKTWRRERVGDLVAVTMDNGSVANAGVGLLWQRDNETGSDAVEVAADVVVAAAGVMNIAFEKRNRLVCYVVGSVGWHRRTTQRRRRMADIDLGWLSW